jgi:Phosphotransferase enzyme family
MRSLDLEDVVRRAAAALSHATGRETRLEEVHILSNPERRNLVVRAVAHDNDGKAMPVVVKATRSSTYDPTTEETLQTSGLVREWVAIACVARVAADGRHGATLLAGDVAAGILVFEDLGEGLQSMVHPLLRGTAEEAEAALGSYAEALGRLHADTVDCLERYRETFHIVFGPRTDRPLGWRVEADAQVIANLLGHAAPADELALLSARLRDPGPWLSLVHGDPCPDNALIVNGRIRLIDYEWARPSHALLDGIYWRMGFPTCWCAGRTPPDVAARLDTLYRKELGRAIPLALDDAAFQAELVGVSAIWLFTALSWRLKPALERDDKWGIWSIRGRLLWYLEQVIAMTAATRALPGIGESAQAWLSILRSRWPEAVPLGYFPAFANEAV